MPAHIPTLRKCEITNVLTEAVPIALMCVLIAGFAPELVLLPVLLPLVFPDAIPLTVAFYAFVIVCVFKLVVGLVRRER